MSLFTLSTEGNDSLFNLERLNREATKVISFYLPCKITHQTVLTSSQQNSGVYNHIIEGWKPGQNFFINIKYSLYESDFEIALTYPRFLEKSDLKNGIVSFRSEDQRISYNNIASIPGYDFTVEFQQTDFGSIAYNSDPNYFWGYRKIVLDESYITMKTYSDGEFYFERYRENSNKWLMSYSSKPGYQSALVAAECENMPEEYTQLLDTMRDHYRLSKNL